MSQDDEKAGPRDNMAQLKEQAAACGPACGCHATGTSGRTRMVVGAVILAAAAALAARAVLKGNSAPARASDAVFAAAPSAGGAPVTAAGPAAPEAKMAPGQTSAPDAAVQGAPGAPADANAGAPEAKPATCGESLKSLGDLNRKALDNDGVFVFLAGKDAAKALAAVAAVEKAAAALRGRGTKVGLFTLGEDSEEYAGLAAQVPPPGVIALAKGAGMSAVTGEITEPRLLQAYLTASSSGGCGPASSGCGPSGCK